MDLGRLTAQAEKLRSATMAARQGPGHKWYSVINQGDTAKIYVYDVIGEWGVTAQDFVSELNAVTASAIDLHVNSEGGQVFDGIAIYAALKRHPAMVTAHVDSLAASAASFIIQAADVRVMGVNARLMIHEAAGVVVGNARDARALADLLDDTSANIASIYAERSGVPVEQWRSAMQAETWYGAQEAVTAGLADTVEGVEPSPENRTVTPVMAAATPPEPVSWGFDIVSTIRENAV